MDFTLLTLETPVDLINQALENSLPGSIGVKITSIAEGVVQGTMQLSSKNARPGNILHGGANLAMGETLAGLGSMLLVDLQQFDVLGIMVSANHTGVLKTGSATAIARIIHRGKQTHVWNVDITDEQGKLLSSVRVTNMIAGK